MPEVMVTTCPSCRLTFRVSDSQLAAANGLVRCGACLKVFNAHEHGRPTPPPTAPEVAPEDSEDLVIDDNFDLSLLDRLLGEPSPASPPPPTAREVPMDGTDPTATDGKPNPPERTPPAPSTAPESAAGEQTGATGAADNPPAEGASPEPTPGDEGTSSTLSILPRDLATPVFTAETFRDPDGEQPRPHRLWYLALLIALLALPLQYGHFNAASLGQDPRLRPFPQLRLRFEDLQGTVVAARTFAPREYLGGELAGATALPSRQPVRLELDIVDPGPAAVSYSLLAVDSGR